MGEDFPRSAKGFGARSGWRVAESEPAWGGMPILASRSCGGGLDGDCLVIFDTGGVLGIDELEESRMCPPVGMVTAAMA